jgi:hypothetical protein
LTDKIIKEIKKKFFNQTKRDSRKTNKRPNKQKIRREISTCKKIPASCSKTKGISLRMTGTKQNIFYFVFLPACVIFVNPI